MDVSREAAKARRIARKAGHIADLIEYFERCDFSKDQMKAMGAILGFNAGAYTVGLLGVGATCTCDGAALVKAWVRAADRWLAKAIAP